MKIHVLLLGLALLPAAAGRVCAQATTDTQAAEPATTSSVERIDALLGNLYPGATPEAGGLPGRPVEEASASTESAPVSTRLIVRRGAAETTGTPETEPPAIDLTLLDATTATTATVLPELPRAVRPDATPQTMPAPTAPPAAAPQAAPTPAPTPTPTPGALAGLRRVRINRASEAELVEALKLEARRARYIIEFRNLYGPFRGPEDLNQVTGLPDELVQRWEQAGVLDFE